MLVVIGRKEFNFSFRLLKPINGILIEHINRLTPITTKCIVIIFHFKIPALEL